MLLDINNSLGTRAEVGSDAVAPTNSWDAGRMQTGCLERESDHETNYRQ